MNIEIPSELAEAIADMAGEYGPVPEGDHTDDCSCRLCFVSDMERRIWESVDNARRLTH